MAPRVRRTLPDNLDPLVATLSNVVGILVIVVVLTQIEVGGALARVVELDGLRGLLGAGHAIATAERESLAERRAALLRRTDVGVEASLARADATLEALEAIPEVSSKDADQSLDALEERLVEARRALAEAREGDERRAAFAAALERVPRRLVARLPDPVIVEGRESWILVRYGRIYLTDRLPLFEQGTREIGRLLPSGENRGVRRDQFESVALYLRKRVVGLGNFRWLLRTQPEVRVELAWRSRDPGLAFTDLAREPAFRAWLRARDPALDFLRFQVWGDSFEAYLAAREVVEAAGFRAGWRAHEVDEELRLPIRFGPAERPIRRLEVD